ncbi:hypothetical protein BDA96_04G177200 [Sorghum bicolor]|uniref:Uncharacterized protein n=2 Tax=Sorghum bicolor TaxID=4558 RepID=A0A921R630_SORBI|nr:hypothetical protein BDA96_04G177200 [Sorghum bicolor]KXG30335.1 hypothetical protein SORBI_3004G165400 [Sorghum bicolor]
MVLQAHQRCFTPMEEEAMIRQIHDMETPRVHDPPQDLSSMFPIQQCYGKQWTVPSPVETNRLRWKKMEEQFCNLGLLYFSRPSQCTLRFADIV